MLEARSRVEMTMKYDATAYILLFAWLAFDVIVLASALRREKPWVEPRGEGRE